MADFAMRAAYYLGLPASGPVPLPKIIERWTMPRSNFVHKKSQENFERITRRRLVQIQDGHPETVQVWLAFLRKHAFYGVGMKANVWQHEELRKFLYCVFRGNCAWLTCDPLTEVGKNMDQAFAEVEKELNAKLATFGWNKSVAATQSVTEMLQKQGAKQVGVPLTDVREASQTREQKI
jgi:ribosomal protein S10